MGRRRSVVGLANEQVAITTACAMIGMDIPDGVIDGRAVKLPCPFGAIWHSDQGLEPTMRIYAEGNNAFCFSRCGFFTPVSLVAMAWGISRRDAAVELLDRVGIKPATLADAWAQATTREVKPDTAMLSEALKTFCARISPDWDEVQFESPVAAKLTRCFTLLDLVRTPLEADQWLLGCKKVMALVLQPNPPCS